VLGANTAPETGERGYVVTGDESFLSPFRQARQRAEAEVETLRELGAQGLDPVALDALAALVDRRLDILDGIVVTRRASGFEAAQALVAGAEGMRLHDQARESIGGMQASVRAAIAPAERHAAQARSLAQGVIVAGGALALVFGGWATRRMRRDLAAQRDADAALREREQALQRTKAQLQRVFDHSLDALCAFDTDGRFVQVSAACERLWGWRPEELLGTRYIDRVVPEDQPRTREVAESIMAGHAVLDFENRYRRRDGRVVHVMWSAQWLPAEQLMFCVARDVSDRHDLLAELQRRHDALQAQADALRAATARAEAADRIKSAFLATMSHELRTPLNSIIGFTGVLLQRLAGPLNDEQARQMEMVRSSARHLLALINDVLDISKIEAGQFEVARAPYDLGEVLQRTAASVQPLAEAKGLDFDVDIDPALAPALAAAVGDARRVGQVLLNLLGNAVKFTEHGRIVLRARAAADAPQHVAIEVDDSGIGIAADQLPKLFQPFRQVDTRLERAYEGTGLGLAISQRLAQLMGGRIEASSRLGEGSCFRVVLPLAVDDDAGVGTG
jgi:PAS domain S-box-containing protein